MANVEMPKIQNVKSSLNLKFEILKSVMENFWILVAEIS